MTIVKILAILTPRVDPENRDRQTLLFGKPEIDWVGRGSGASGSRSRR